MENLNRFDRAAVIEAQNAIQRSTDQNQRSLDALSLLGIVPKHDKALEYLHSRASLGKAIHDLHTLRGLSGAEAELNAELRKTQLPQMMNSILWPLAQTQTRALSSAADASLVQSLTLPAADALRANSVCAGLGCTVIPLPSNGAGNFSLPTVSGTATAQWLTAETTQISESDQTFGQVVFSPRTAGVYSEQSRLINLQAPAIARIVEHDHQRLIANLIDLAAIYGTGNAGQPRGIANTTGIGTFSAASANISTLVAAQTALGVGLTSSAGFAATLANAGTLRTRLESSANTTGTLWQGSLIAGTLAGLPARSSTALTANDLVLGSWEHLVIPIWGAAEVSVNPYDPTNFRTGTIGIRTMVTLDVGLTFPQAFSLGTGFT